MGAQLKDDLRPETLAEIFFAARRHGYLELPEVSRNAHRPTPIAAAECMSSFWHRGPVGGITTLFYGSRSGSVAAKEATGCTVLVSTCSVEGYMALLEAVMPPRFYW